MQILPYYLAIGMPYDLFWNGDPILAKVYREAHEYSNRQKNQEMWMQGIYFLKGLQTVAEKVASGLSGKSSSRTSEYPQEPIPITEEEQKEALERNKQRTLAWAQKNQ